MSSYLGDKRPARGIALFIVLIAAKLAAMWHALPAWSPWSAVAFTWQEAALSLGVALVDASSQSQRPMAGQMVKVAIVIYWTMTASAVINIPVGRVLGTPLTLPMLKATGGALTDSLRLHMTWVNVLLMIATIVSAAALPRALARLRPTSRRLILVTAITLTALGPSSMRHAEGNGVDRSGVVAFAESLGPHVRAVGDRRDWRDSPFPSVPSAIDTLAPLHGAAHDRNVVVVSLESTAAQYLSLYGGGDDITPTVSALSRNGIVFEHAYATYPESIKGLFAILCSTFPAFDISAEALSQTPCDAFPSVLQRHGYRTALFHSGRFEYLGMSDVIRGRGFGTLEDAGDIGGHHQSSFGVDEPATVERILHWVDDVPRGRPFLVTYLPIAGHHPYETSSPEIFGKTSPDDFSRYRSAVHDGDRALKTLRDGFRTRGLDDRTIWILFGDHGEAFGQHSGNYGHTFFVYEENVHVPLVIAAPGLLHAQQRIPDTMSLVDVAPTLLDLVGMAPPTRYQGLSALDGRPRMALFLTDYSLPLAGLVDGAWKAIENVATGHVQLFELANDAGERRDVSTQYQDRVRRYATTLQGWAAAQKDYILKR